MIGIVFSYSYFFYPAAHPIDCFVKQHTGKNCPTCGFSRAFSYYSHFQFNIGKQYNPLSWPVFLYLALQFFMRLSIVCYYSFTKKIVNSALLKADVIISISGFLLAFLPILFNFLTYG
ncbi:MAG: DUF2752 domain-containing protein [Bacteroidia bacterium]